MARSHQRLGIDAIQKALVRHPAFFRLLLALIILLLGVFLLRSVNLAIGWDFRNNLWAPSRLLLTNQSPYQVKLLFETSNAIWMPTAIGLFWPLGLLSLPAANMVWFLFNLFVYMAIIYLAMADQIKFWLFVGLVLVCATFPFLVAHFVLGQISLLICLAMLVMVDNLSQSRPMLVGLCLVIGLIKPQLMIVILPLLFWQMLSTGKTTKGIYLIASAVVWGGLFLVPLFVACPSWPKDAIMNLRINPVWAHPNLHTKLFQWFGMPRLLTTLMLAAISGWFLWLCGKRQNWNRMYLFGLAFTTVVSPYVWSWDFVLLLPLYAHTLSNSCVERWRKGVLLSGSMLIMGLYAYQKVSVQGDDSSAWWVSLAFLGLLIFVNPIVNNHSDGDECQMMAQSNQQAC